MWYKTRAVWAGELLDTVRDKRTLYVMVLLPIVLMPLMMAIGPFVLMRQQEAIEETVPVMSFVGGEGLDALPAWMEASGRIAVEPALADVDGAGRAQLEQRLFDETIDLIVFVDNNAAELVAAESTIPFEVVFNSARQRSVTAMQRFETLLGSYRTQVADERLMERGLSTFERNDTGDDCCDDGNASEPLWRGHGRISATTRC